MKKGVIFLLLIMTLSVTIGCQTVQYDSPQTVEWDEPEGVVSGYYVLTSYEVEVIHRFDDKDLDTNYLGIGAGITLREILVDLEAAGYFGIFIVSIRANLTLDGAPLMGERAYSDNADDIATETFYIINHPDTKPRAIRIR